MQTNRTPLQIACAAVLVLSVVACDRSDREIETTSAGETNLSPSADSAAERDRSMVRVVNAVDGGQDVTVQLGDSVLFDGVKAASVTDYRETAANLANFSVRASGAPAGTAIAKNDEVLMDGSRYTIILISEDMATSVLRVVRDDVIPDSGKARLRVIHAAPGAPEVDVRVVGATESIFEGVNFKSEAGYRDLEPAKVALEVRAKDSGKRLLRIPAVDLQRATSTTIVLTGRNTLKSFMFTDAVVGPARTS